MCVVLTLLATTAQAQGREKSTAKVVGFSLLGGRHGGDEMADTGKPRLGLIGEDGNALAILGRARRVLRAAGREDQFEGFMAQATSGDYDHLLRVVMEWFEVDG